MLLSFPPKEAVRAGLNPAKGSDAYFNVANSVVDNLATPPKTMPRFHPRACALHHISEKHDAVVI
jgi:hypothetical protein